MQLVITALGAQDSALFEQLVTSIRESDCQVQECRMTQFVGGCACFLLVDGRWNHIARLENLLTALQQEGQLFFQRLGEATGESESNNTVGDLLYMADVVTRERTGVLEGLVGFFTQHGVKIQDLRCSSYRLPYVDAIVCTIHMLLRIPRGIAVLSMRDDFLDFCEQMQVDAVLEPIKPIV